MRIAGKKFGVIGLGRSGVAVARFLAARDARVVATDREPLEKLSEEARHLAETGIELHTGSDTCPELLACDTIIVSPGVKLDNPALQLAAQKNIPVLGEIELAYRFCPALLVALTGTKGKTTTATLLGEMLQASGFPVVVAGNIGTALIAAVENVTEDHVVVAEVSSFQLETIEQFRPHIGILLNISPDHLDRHGTLDNYAQIKAKLFANQTERDFAILNADDERVFQLTSRIRSQIIGYSVRRAVDQGIFINGDDCLRSAIHHHEGAICARADIPLPGMHNVGNALAATAAALLLGCERETLAEVIRSFSGVPHRLEPVAEVRGVLFVNDSQGTTPFAVIAGLQAYDRPVHLIAGGRPKVDAFDDLGAAIAKHCASLTCIGESAHEIAQASERHGMHAVFFSDTLEQATRDTFSRARPGDVILLSPGCASFDMFTNFEERGEAFRRVAQTLADEQGEMQNEQPPIEN